MDERTDLYRVLDQSSGGVRLQARYLPRTDPALLGRLRLVRDVRLHNQTPDQAGQGDRTLAEIHPAELAATVHDVLRAACSADRRELVAECVRRLDLRPARSFTTALDPVLDRAVAAGQVVVSAGRYRLEGA